GISTSQLQQPVDTLPDAIAAVLDLLFAEHCAIVIDHTDVMMIRSPIDSRVIPVCLGCRPSSFARPAVMLRQSLYWRSVPRRKLPTGRASRTPHRGPTPRQALGRRWASLALSVGRPSLLKWYRASRADQRVRPTKFPRPPASFSRLLPYTQCGYDLPSGYRRELSRGGPPHSCRAPAERRPRRAGRDCRPLSEPALSLPAAAGARPGVGRRSVPADLAARGAPTLSLRCG